MLAGKEIMFLNFLGRVFYLTRTQNSTYWMLGQTVRLSKPQRTVTRPQQLTALSTETF